MGNQYKLIIFSLFFIASFAQIALALSSTGATDRSDYNINQTINYTLSTDQNLTSNITIYLINSSGTVFNYTSVYPNATNFTTQVNSTVPRSGEYVVKANFTLNNTYYETSQIVKISKAHNIVISSNKPAYSPGEAINFTVRATDVNNIGVSDENVTVRLLYANNDTALASKVGLTNAAGEYMGTFTAPNTIGSYRLTVNDWVAVKLIDISAFDLVTFVGDVNGNIKTKFSQGDTGYVYMDLFDTNKTRYTGTETLSIQITFPNGTQNTSASYTYAGSRLNASFALSDIGEYKAKVTVVSTSKSIALPIEVGKYEIVGSLERNSTPITTFFPNEEINVRVKVVNISSGEVIKTTNLEELFELSLLDSSFLNFSSISNTTTIDTTTGVRTFRFNAPNVNGLYYVKVRLNKTQLVLDMKVTNMLPTASPVDQNYNFKNIFVGNKQVIRIITILENSTSQINVTNISVISLKTAAGTDVTASTIFNTSITEYKGFKAGLVEFASPPSAGLYFLRTLVNNNFAAETQFIIKLYTACAQLDGYKWFVSSNEDVNLTVRVAEAQDISIIDSLAGNSTDSTNTDAGSSSFSNIYGGYDCYSAYKTTASGTSTAGNNTVNIRVSIKKIVNTLNGEDVTTKVSNLPSNTTDDNGRVALTLKKPSGGWDGGTYVVELELRDKNNNTDKGFGAFQVKNLWINVWPQQISGRWKWYFSPTENMTFDVNAYNSTGTWYYYGNNQGTGDSCYLVDLFYQGNGIEWFWPPKKISVNKYNWTCSNSSAPANGRFTLRINHTTPTDAFDSGYYMVRVKVNTTSGVGDSGEGWFSLKAYNVYVRTTSSNYYDSWYRGPTDNVTIDIDVTYANSTKWDCYWQKCPSTELVRENLNISAKLIRYDQWMPTDYQKDKYLVLFANSSVASVSTSALTAFNDSSIAANVSVNTTKNVTFVEERFKSGNSTANTFLVAAAKLPSAGWNASVTIEIPQNATVNSAYVTVLTNESMTINVSLNATTHFLNVTTAANSSANTGSNVTFTSNLNTLLSTCSANPEGNCTVALNATLNGTGSATFYSMRISYNQIRNVQANSNTSVFITLPRNATIDSAFIGLNMTSGNLTANLSLTYVPTSSPVISIFFSTDNLNVTLSSTSFINSLSSLLNSCTLTGGGNCTIGFNVSLYGTGTATLSNPRVTFSTTTTIQNTSSLFINTTTGNANLTLVPRGGKNSDSWASGYYTVAVSVDGPQGKETGNYWFEIRNFFVNLQPVKPTNVRQVAYAYTSGQNLTVNVSATNKPSWLYNSYGVSNVNNIPANITDMKLSYWDYTTYQMRETAVTWTPSIINNMTTVNITPASTLTAGNWYNLEVTLADANGNNQTGWAGFQIKDFTLSARTKNWQYAFTNAENISLDVAVCDSDTWWCNFDSNSYSGNDVAVSVTKLMKSDSWPYTAVSAWTANTSTLTSSNNGKGVITISPTSNLSGGYYSAELSAKYASGSGSNTTTNIWFKVESFKLEVQGIKWEYSMSENVTLKIKTSAAATLSDAQITCGYWPDQTSYSLSGGTLSANSTSLSSGENLIMLSPSGKNWVSGYCYGYLTVTSGGESQQAYTSFSIKAFTLTVTQPKYAYLKNESIILTVSSDATQQFNITDIQISFYDYYNTSSDIKLTLNNQFTSNGTSQRFTGNATISLTPTGGNWSFKGWHNGKLTVVAGNNAAISQTAWFYFDIRDVFYAYGWPVVSGTTNYFTPNTSSETINYRVYTYKYSQSGSGWWPYTAIGGVNVTITSIEKQSCSTYPCSYSAVTGWTADNTTTNSNGQAQLNITRSGGWPDGWHYMNVRLLDTATGESTTLNRQMGFWVNK